MGGVAPPLPAFFRLIGRDETGSTNDDAADAARSGAPEGTLIWARRQTKGRGRRGRPWVSPEGNLHLSIVLRPEVAAVRAGEVAFVAALAAADACAALAPGADVRCKWPNDVLIAGRKVGGLLIESSLTSSGQVEWLVVGIGLNLAAHPEAVEFPATHLALHAGRAIAVEEGLSTLANAFAARYRQWREQGFAAVRAAWLARAAGLGGPIRVRLDRAELTGTFADIATDGALMLTLADGAERRITAGDVFFPGVSSDAAAG
jgi:BirA family transcriptional regulator, biotin operon repressor / biotin---[acetyl-CoA-carboxylase] ligase